MTCSCTVRDFCVQINETWHPTLRWGSGLLSSRPVTGIAQSAPAEITVPGHGIPAGWPVALTGVRGMTQINANHYPPGTDEYHYTTLVDSDTIQLNDISSADMAVYASGGFVVFNTPQSLAGATAVLNIYDNPDHDGAPLVALTSSGGGLTLDDTLKTITPLLQTAGLTWPVGYYTLLVTTAGGVVTELMRGTITLE